MSNPIFVKGKFLSKESKFLDKILSSNYGLATKISDNMCISNGMMGHYKTGAARMRPSLFKEILDNINKELGTDYNQTNFSSNVSENLEEYISLPNLHSTIKDKKIESLMDNFLSTSASIKIKFLLNIYPNIFTVNNYSQIVTLNELEAVIDEYNSL